MQNIAIMNRIGKAGNIFRLYRIVMFDFRFD